MSSRRSPEGKTGATDNLRFYDAISEIYDGIYAEVDPIECVRQWLQLFDSLGLVAAEDIRCAEPPTMVDVGCGTGVYLQAWAAAHFHVIGVDGSRAMLAKASERLSRSAGSIELVHQNVLSPDGSQRLPKGFDIAVGHFNFLNMFSRAEVPRVLRTLSTWGKPGAWFVTDCSGPELLPDSHTEQYCFEKNRTVSARIVSSVSDNSVRTIYRWDKKQSQCRYWLHRETDLARSAHRAGWRLQASKQWRPDRPSNPWPQTTRASSARVVIFQLLGTKQ